MAGHSKRQKAYSHARGDREVYTPQVVVNGAVQTLGSDQAAIERAIAQSRRNTATLSQPLTLAVANGRVTVAASAARSDASKSDASAEVWLCPVSKAVEVAIGRGENSGHTITYHNVVRRWVKLGVWKGNAESWSIPLEDVKSEGVDAVAVILQSGTAAAPGVMIGAAMTSLDSTKTASPLIALTLSGEQRWHGARAPCPRLRLTVPAQFRRKLLRQKKGQLALALSVGGLNLTRNKNKGVGRYKLRGAGGLRNPKPVPNRTL